MDSDSGTLTWEDVFAVCKMMECACGESGFEDGTYIVVKKWGDWGTSFSDPSAALEFITTPEHPLEKKYANILRTKP